jgi:hypothetical protein
MPTLRTSYCAFLTFFVFLLICGSATIASAQTENTDSEPMLDFGEDRYTISAWIKTEPDAEGGPLFTVGPLNGTWSTGCKSLYLDPDGRINLRVSGAGHDRGPKLNDGEWHHIVMPSLHSWHFFIDGQRAFMYILDGVPDPGNPRNPIPGNPPSVFKIGQGVDDYPNDALRQFNGLIDDMRIYDDRMSDEQILELYEGRTEFPGMDLLAHWAFDKSIQDETDNDNDLRSIGTIDFVGGRDDGTAASFNGQNSLWLPLTDSGEGKEGRVITAELPEISPPTYQNAQYEPELVEETGFRQLLIVKRDTYNSSHFYSDYIDGCSRFGSNICILDLMTGDETPLFEEPMTDGIFGRVDLSFDATKIVFGWKASEWEGFRIYEANIDGSGLTQLTFRPDDEDRRIAMYDQSTYLNFAKIYHHQTDDMHPCYMPDGGIMFASSRCEYGTLCNSDDQLATTVLYRIEGDGSNMQKLTNSAVSEFTPSLLEDGRILYTRWEYVDKGQIGVKCLWSMNPDGTASREVYGNDVRFPPTFIQGRQIPGRSDLYVTIGSPHWPHSGTGTVILVDTSKPIRTLEPMSYVTPYVKVMQEPGYNQYDFETNLWTRASHGPLYRDPYPLSESLFIVSHNPHRDRDAKDATAYGIYLLDTSCHHKLIYDDPDTSVWCAQPIRPRVKPPLPVAAVDESIVEQGLALCSVQDIYHGMEGVERGEVKWIRIMEQIPRPWAARRRWEPACGHTQPAGGAGPLSVKLLRGVVPVEEDGSAYFYVPADRNIYFQALNEDFLELQRERTYVNYRPGEVRSCVGCHETPNDTPPRYTSARLAMMKPPIMPMPQPGDETAARPLHYSVDVQPILDEHCVSCHGAENPAADLRLTGEDTWLANTSFNQLISKGYVTGFKEGSDFGGTEYSPAKTIGSYVSPLMRQIKEGCPGNDHELSLAEFARIATWVDTNGVYSGSYWGRLVPPHADHPNYRPITTLEESLSTINPYEEWTPDWISPKLQQEE